MVRFGGGTSTRRLPKFCSEFRDRHGKLRIRFRRGRVSAYLEHHPWTPEGQIEYQALVDGTDPRAAKPIGADRSAPGSISALVVDFYSSPQWTALQPSTQRTYRNAIEAEIRSPHGALPVRALQRKHVQAMVDKRADRPTVANRFLSLLSILMRHAVRRGYRDDDPTRDVQKIRYRSDGFHAWTEDEIEAFRLYWPIGSRERLALELLLGTGQRRSDVVRMGPQHVKDGRIAVNQQKTRARLEIPLHPALTDVLAETEVGNLAFLIARGGRPFSPAGFTNWFRGAVTAAGLPKRCVPHGLRKAAARRLAEAGATPHQIAAITGHQTLSEVARYARSANMATLAEQAMSLLTRTEGEQKLSNRLARLDKKSRK